MHQLPDYEAKKAISTQLVAEEMASIAATRSSLLKVAQESASNLLDLTKVDDLTVRLNAVKYHLKLCGLEVEKHEHELNGQLDPIQIILPPQDGGAQS